jgi:integrase
MTGSLKKRSGNSWSIILFLGQDPATGKKRQKWVTVHGNKKDAERELNRLVNELNTGAYIEPCRDTLETFLTKWLEMTKPSLAGKTHERYAEIVKRHLVPALGAVFLAKIQPMHIQSYYLRALESGRLDGNGGLSAQTVLHHHRVLHGALQQAVKWQLLVRNPADAVEPPKPEQKEMRALDEDRSAWLLEAADGNRLYIPILIAITTGMRRGEILGLMWRDIDFINGFIRVQRSVEQTNAGVRFKEPKKKKSRRPIVMLGLLIEALERHRERQNQFKNTLGSDYEDNDLICSYDDGRIWVPESFTSSYFQFTKRIGVRIRFHDLRHTHASQLLRAGVSAKVVSERLGHSAIGITLDTYSHILPGMQEEAAARMDVALRAAIGKHARRLT